MDATNFSRESYDLTDSWQGNLQISVPDGTVFHYNGQGQDNEALQPTSHDVYQQQLQNQQQYQSQQNQQQYQLQQNRQARHATYSWTSVMEQLPDTSTSGDHLSAAGVIPIPGASSRNVYVRHIAGQQLPPAPELYYRHGSRPPSFAMGGGEFGSSTDLSTYFPAAVDLGRGRVAAASASQPQPEVDMPGAPAREMAFPDQGRFQSNSRPNAYCHPLMTSFASPTPERPPYSRSTSASTFTSDYSHSNYSMLLSTARVVGALADTGPHTAARGMPLGHLSPSPAVSARTKTKKRPASGPLQKSDRRREEASPERACIQCYLSHAGCTSKGSTISESNPCQNCVKKVRGTGPLCFSSRLEHHNIFYLCLNEDPSNDVARIIKRADWKSERADKLVEKLLGPRDLNGALDLISMMKFGQPRAFDQLVRTNTDLSNDFVFGPLYKACIILQCRNVLQRASSSTFAYTQGFENHVLVLRAVSMIRVFKMVEDRMEKNKLRNNKITDNSARACYLVIILGMLLLQTLGFHNSLPPAIVADEAILESRRILAYDLLFRLQFMARMALKRMSLDIDSLIVISDDLDKIKIDDRLWTYVDTARKTATESADASSSPSSPSPYTPLSAQSADKAYSPDVVRRDYASSPLQSNNSDWYNPDRAGRNVPDSNGTPSTGSMQPAKRGRKKGKDQTDMNDARDAEELSYLLKHVAVSDDNPTFLHEIYDTETGTYVPNPEGVAMLQSMANPGADDVQHEADSAAAAQDAYYVGGAFDESVYGASNGNGNDNGNAIGGAPPGDGFHGDPDYRIQDSHFAHCWERDWQPGGLFSDTPHQELTDDFNGNLAISLDDDYSDNYNYYNDNDNDNDNGSSSHDPTQF